ncbi:MAG TPA: hypothetical protein VHX40_07910 [Acidimicrobiales bacterium]|nr:hypothetical protein [Acidimicrobiales bacterium]
MPVIGRAAPDGVPIARPTAVDVDGSMASVVEATWEDAVDAPAGDAPPGEPKPPAPRTTTATVSPPNRANRR